jgi:DNA mismatch repair ATPase MutL
MNLMWKLLTSGTVALLLMAPIAAQQTADQQKADQQKAAEEKTAQEKAAQEKAAQEKAAGKPAQETAAQPKTDVQKTDVQKTDAEKADAQKTEQANTAQPQAAPQKAGSEEAVQDVAAPAPAPQKNQGVILAEGEGRDVVVAKCTVCHDLQRVRSTYRDQQAWIDLVNNMISRGAVVTPDEARTITTYLFEHYGL